MNCARTNKEARDLRKQTARGAMICARTNKEARDLRLNAFFLLMIADHSEMVLDRS